MGCDRGCGPPREGTIARFTETVINVVSLVVVGVGIVVTASFFVGSPHHDAEAEVAPKVDAATKEPEVPVAARKFDRAIERQNHKAGPEKKGTPVIKKKRGPANKMLRMTIPKMAQIRNDAIPYSVSDDEKAFHDYAAVHLRGTGNPWDKQANVYIAGHRLGYPGTHSWLSFWDLNVLEKGDRIFIRDATGKRYVYRVFRIFVVGPDDVSVTRPLKGRNIVSLQTCTLPDYSKRLVVQAQKVVRR
ncbi:MAG: class E sortase [Actinomycetota bacterium]|nr:class E sortase [Actinomycetota bacterium]